MENKKSEESLEWLYLFWTNKWEFIIDLFLLVIIIDELIGIF